MGAFRPAEAEKSGRIRAARAADLGAIAVVDRPAFGADREYLLRRLFGFCDQFRALVQDGSITGYAAAWPNVDVTVIGPVIAPDAAAARTLITSVARRIDRSVRLDLDPDRRDIAEWRKHAVSPSRAKQPSWCAAAHGRPSASTIASSAR